MQIFRLAVLALAVLLPAVRAEDASTDPAVATFRKEMEAMEAFAKEQGSTVKANPLAGISTMRKLVEKVKAIKSNALPADLKEAFSGFATAFGRLGEEFKDWPETPEDIQAFLVKKAKDDPEFAVQFRLKWRDRQKEIEPLAKRLQEVGAKYGIEIAGKLTK